MQYQLPIFYEPIRSPRSRTGDAREGWLASSIESYRKIRKARVWPGLSYGWWSAPPRGRRRGHALPRRSPGLDHGGPRSGAGSPPQTPSASAGRPRTSAAPPAAPPGRQPDLPPPPPPFPASREVDWATGPLTSWWSKSWLIAGYPGCLIKKEGRPFLATLNIFEGKLNLYRQKKKKTLKALFGGFICGNVSYATQLRVQPMQPSIKATWSRSNVWEFFSLKPLISKIHMCWGGLEWN